ncbi:MAG: amino acid permease, partial [Acidobacteria bacterium]|nr:amino acid permease [Acidobacteriota bacterium]
YMVGVFIAFTLSQAGMVVHWLRSQERKGRRRRIAVNAFGAFTTGLVLIIVAVEKFVEGAWVILATIPLLVWICRQIRQHYFQVAVEISPAAYERVRDLKHTVVVPVAGVSRVSLGAIEYARSLSKDVIAVQVNADGSDPDKLVAQWESWVEDVPLVVLNSPYRSILRPLLRFIEEVEDFRDDDVVTVLLPEFVPGRWWHRVLHNQNALILRSVLAFKPKVVVTSVRRHLRRRRND